jgi:hypothetical protein
MTVSPTDITKVPDIIKAVDAILAKLSPYKPSVKKLDIDCQAKSSEIRLGVNVPHGMKRKLRDIEIPAYEGYCIREIVDESFNVVKVVPQLKGGNWVIDAQKLPKSEHYLIFMSGTVTNETLKKLVRIDVPGDPVKEDDKDSYWIHSGIRDVSLLEAMYTELNLDKILTTVKVGVERTFSSSVPSEIIDYYRERAMSDIALSGHDRQQVFNQWRKYRSAKRNIGNLKPFQIIDVLHKLVDPQSFRIYVSIDSPFRVHEIATIGGIMPPESIAVNVFTNLNYRIPAADGNLIFKKREFSDNIQKEFKDLIKEPSRGK